MIDIDLIVGARPNFIKAKAILYYAYNDTEINIRLIHTGQHYSYIMSKQLLEELDIHNIDLFLHATGKDKAEILASVTKSYNDALKSQKPDFAVVVGDVTSTLAAAITAKYNDVALVHVEAGLRSFDREMPEELNRVMVDQISDMLFVTEDSAIVNLANEGVDKNRICYAGNVMIDTMEIMKSKIDRSTVLKENNINEGEYCFTTLHRPSNVDNPKRLRQLCFLLRDVSQKIKVVFSAHPRTLEKLKKFGFYSMLKSESNVLLIEPQGYINAQKLIKDSRFVMTDSGGIQEESSYYNIPCITLRKNTERPITIDEGTNVLVFSDWTKLQKYISCILAGNWKQSRILSHWDGKAGLRILRAIKERHWKLLSDTNI